MQKLTINEELKTLLPPLTAEEFATLESGILENGCLSPLIVWGDILIDGHHRYEICTRHEIPFSVQNIVFENLDTAKHWAWQHQKGRRNMEPYQRVEMAVKFKEVIASKAKERQRGGQGGILLCPTLDKANPIDTKRELAAAANVSHGTLVKGEFISKNADEETKEKLRKGEKGVTINSEYKRLKSEKAAQAEKPATSKPGKKGTKKTGGNPSDALTVTLKSSPKVNEKYCCGVKFEPDPDDDFYDWISDEERAELFEMRKTCPNRLMPQIHNFTIQNIPEHKPDQLINCLFSLFKVRYREKLAAGLLEKMFYEDGKEIAISIATNFINNFQNQ